MYICYIIMLHYSDYILNNNQTHVIFLYSIIFENIKIFYKIISSVFDNNTLMYTLLRNRSYITEYYAISSLKNFRITIVH